MTTDPSAYVDVTPTPEAGKVHLRRGADGTYALLDTRGGFIAADAETFVEVRR